MDANVLINLMHVGRLDLLGRLPGYAFAVTPDVIAEIVRPDQKRQIEAALQAGTLRREELSDPTAVALFAELRPQMGAGEAATLALACQKGWAIASDEKNGNLHFGVPDARNIHPPPNVSSPTSFFAHLPLWHGPGSGAPAASRQLQRRKKTVRRALLGTPPHPPAL